MIYENEKYKIFKGDNLKILGDMESNSVDLIFADPPYYMQTDGILKRTDGSDFAGVDDEWDKFESIDAYCEYTKKWLIECKRILKKGGSIWVIGSFQNIYLVGNIMQELDFWILNDIIWEKSNPVPNFAGTRFCNAHETLLWCTPEKNSPFTFNYKTMKFLNNGKQMRSVWNIPICTGSERLVGEDGKKAHNTQKPLKLLENVVLSSSKKGDVILDPFSGTATTGAAALLYDRKYIGIEREDKYVDISIDRLENIQVSKDVSLVENTLDIKLKAVPMKSLLEEKYLNEGDILYDKNGNNPGVITKKGYILIEGVELSIHKAAALVLSQVNHNGWDFWYYMEDDKLFSIDELRIKYRSEYVNK